MGCGASQGALAVGQPAAAVANRGGHEILTTQQRTFGEYFIRKVREEQRAGALEHLRALVEELMEQEDFDINYADKAKGWTAYHYACDEGLMQQVVILLGCGCDTARLTPQGQTGWGRARRGRLRGADVYIRERCDLLAGFLESVAKKGEHINLRFEWARQMLIEGEKLEKKQDMDGAHVAYKIGAVRLNYRAAQLSRRAKVLLMETMAQFGPEPEVSLTGFEHTADGHPVPRHPVPQWIHPAQREALREALYGGLSSGQLHALALREKEEEQTRLEAEAAAAAEAARLAADEAARLAEEEAARRKAEEDALAAMPVHLWEAHKLKQEAAAEDADAEARRLGAPHRAATQIQALVRGRKARRVRVHIIGHARNNM